MSRLRIAVVGAGNIAQQHLPVLTDHPECEVVALCDTNPAMLAETAERFAIPQQVAAPEQLLRRDNLDAVFVLVSVLAVAKVAGMFLDAGMPTFLEKPPGIYSSDTERLAEIAARRGTVHMVGLNRRFYASHLAARQQLLEHGPLATLTVEAHEDLSTKLRQKFPPLVIRRWAYANGIHALDLLRFFGGDVEEVQPFSATFENEFPDCHTAVLRFAGGAHGRALVDWISPGGHRFELRCVGARAASSPGFSFVSLNIRGQPERRFAPDDDDRRFKPGFWKQDSAFLAGVRQGHQPAFPAPSLDDAHRTMVMIDRIFQLPAAENG
ncbi:MAG: Gfo/Idh/MocA family oxidoreductase [Chloroflexi bacterium]|nr:Gfo/Idh/MocA family oxidoreductase [Chloroflexota bacterium]